MKDIRTTTATVDGKQVTLYHVGNVGFPSKAMAEAHAAGDKDELVKLMREQYERVNLTVAASKATLATPG